MPRPKGPLIESDRAVRVALEMIDEDGLGAFSLERLSRRLGVRGPSLYHHFADRADLLGRVAEQILHEVPDVFALDSVYSELPWDRRLLVATLELRRAIRRHHKAGPLLLEHFPRRLVLGTYERALDVLDQAEVPVKYHVILIEGLEKLALGFGLSRPAEQSSRWLAFPDVSEDEFPALAGALEAVEQEEDALFESTCLAFLDGAKLEIEREADVEPRPRTA